MLPFGLSVSLPLLSNLYRGWFLIVEWMQTKMLTILSFKDDFDVLVKCSKKLKMSFSFKICVTILQVIYKMTQETFDGIILGFVNDLFEGH